MGGSTKFYVEKNIREVSSLAFQFLTFNRETSFLKIMLYDEAFFRREGTLTRSWYPRGNKSTVDCPTTKEKVGACGAVNPHDDSLLSLVFDSFDSDTFLSYLK